MNTWTLIDGDNTLLTNFDLTEDSVVLDFGGYIGDWSAKIIEKYNPYVKIYEPINEFYNILIKRFENNPKVTVINKAAWIIEEQLDFGIEKDTTGLFNHSELKEIVNGIDVAKEIHDKIDLLKINIEGSEYAVLERLIKTGIIDKISNIIVQFHDSLVLSEIMMKGIQSYLSQTHNLVWSFPYIWEHWKHK